MEYLINYYTNDFMDKLVCEGRYPMNSLSLMIPLFYANKLVDLNWNDIYFAFVNGYINNSDVVDFATMLLDSDETLNLFCPCSNDIDSEYIISFLNKKADKSTINNSKQKWLYVILSFLYDKRNCFEDVFRAVEVIYADFEYPKTMIPFVRYMANSENEIYSNWKKYLSSNTGDGSVC